MKEEGEEEKEGGEERRMEEQEEEQDKEWKEKKRASYCYSFCSRKIKASFISVWCFFLIIGQFL